MVVLLPVVIALLGASPARGERTQTYSIQGADCAACGDRVKDALKKVGGVKKVTFDPKKVEIEVRMADRVSDDAVLAGVAAAGLTAVVGAGKGGYQPVEPYPASADVATLTADGSKVGPLDRLRVHDKFTVFDVYADWCGPCRTVDRELRRIVAERKDVAVRKLNVVDFDSPLARELGPDFDGLPYVIVFSPRGKRTDIIGADLGVLAEALKK